MGRCPKPGGADSSPARHISNTATTVIKPVAQNGQEVVPWGSCELHRLVAQRYMVQNLAAQPVAAPVVVEPQGQRRKDKEQKPFPEDNRSSCPRTPGAGPLGVSVCAYCQRSILVAEKPRIRYNPSVISVKNPMTMNWTNTSAPEPSNSNCWSSKYVLSVTIRCQRAYPQGT